MTNLIVRPPSASPKGLSSLLTSAHDALGFILDTISFTPREEESFSPIANDCNTNYLQANANIIVLPTRQDLLSTPFLMQIISDNPDYFEALFRRLKDKTKVLVLSAVFDFALNGTDHEGVLLIGPKGLLVHYSTSATSSTTIPLGKVGTYCDLALRAGLSLQQLENRIDEFMSSSIRNAAHYSWAFPVKDLATRHPHLVCRRFNSVGGPAKAQPIKID